MTKVTVEERHEGWITTVMHDDPLKMSEAHHSTTAERFLYSVLAAQTASHAQAVGVVLTAIRERDESQNKLAKLIAHLKHEDSGWKGPWEELEEYEDSRADLAAAREDTKRLDWLENNRSSGVGANRTKRLVGLSPDGTSVQEWKEWAGNTVREAIDAALAASNEDKT